jgi:hypothetical protein
LFTGSVIVAVAISSLVLLLLLVIVYFRRKRFLQRGGLTQVVHKYYSRGSALTDRQRDLFVALLCYEDRYPSFAAILAKVASKFPLTYFSKKPEFQHALANLVDLSDSGTDISGLAMGERAALATLVRVVIDDPHVQEIYGKDLEPLVDTFLEEIQAAP